MKGLAMKRMRAVLVSLPAALPLAAMVAGCAEVPPPKELVDARAAYDHAAAGPAVKLAPGPLDTAKQALQRAERNFRDEEDSQETRALAYIADRRARLSEAAAIIKQAEDEKVAAEAEFKDKSMSEIDRAKKRLEDEKNRLEAEKRAREDAEKGRSQAEKDRDKARAEKDELEKKYMAAIASLKEMASVKEEQRGVVITLNGAVLFASGKSELLAIAKEKLNDVAKVLKDQNNPPLRIEGHTDSVGSADENRKLSLARAESVKAQLVSQGYPSDKIKTVGLGPDRPVADNGSAEGRANNRRVEIIVNPRD
ncbi:MAG TPA: OmpA family protein [Polyangiaceae bacterium]|jgi:outer membrane protein OmpA-like peptidoglycan-associated protein|nr:OmpA family protein [Polyangiaceae bacterium]